AIEELIEKAGPYEIRERIASGGMGSVYRAFDKKLERDVAVKVLLAGAGATEEDVQRFRREAAAAARLRHSNIVSIHAVGDAGGYPYIVMDYVDGNNLADLVEAGSISPRRALDITEQIADALHYAHLRGVVHRDLKPANIIIDNLGRAQLTDFGLAKRLDEKINLTRTGTTMGTPMYMAPEQAEGLLEEIDAQSDVYGLGAVLYEMLTGRPPFEGENTMKLLIDVIEEEPPGPRAFNPRINRDIETICLTAMAKTKRRRYSSALALAEDIRRFKRGEAIEARPAGMAGRLVRRLGRSWPLLATAAAALTAAVVTGGYFYMKAREETTQYEAARQEKALALLKRSREMLAEGDDRGALNAALEAKSHLAELEGAEEAAEAARHAGRLRKAAQYLALARSFLTTGKYDAAESMFDLVLSEFDPESEEAVAGLRLARGTGTISVKTTPEGARVVVIPAEEREKSREIGRSPVSVVDMEMGRYCLRLELKDHPVQEIAFEMGRSEAVSFAVALPPRNVPPDMVPVKRKADSGVLFYIDRYEYPGRWGGMPRTGMSYIETQAACGKEGKRLCTLAEWHLACAGEEGRTYPYGERFKEGRCNAGGGSGSGLSAAGFFTQCVSPYGAFDMSGNVAEWVTVPPEGAITAGGNWMQALAPNLTCSSTQFFDPGRGWERVGFRCCLDGPAKSALAGLPMPSGAPAEAPAESGAPQQAADTSALTACPDGMIQINDAYCIDRYEYPNQAGDTPRALVSWIEAQALCRKAGKRLCTLDEWQTACGGPGKWRYPYGNTWRKGACRDGQDRFTSGPAASGSMALCVSPHGAFDMTGNLAEWVSDDAGEGFRTIVGGSFAGSPQEVACASTLSNLAESRSRHIGFRCCASLAGGVR
ncbi:MAG TPA: hypothetical protein ENN09_07760, partial [Planctomycetes bacterium]|nr:hypothetical protein [Planctomycetota bacterium]